MKQITDSSFFYRWRYVLGYSLLGLTLLAVLLIAILYAPGGLTQSEIDMVAKTNRLMSGDIAIDNIPFHALQAGIFLLFGVSIITVKLPAALTALTAVIALLFLLRRWFKPNITILSMSIMFATGQFIYLAQSFTPGIVYILMSALILLFASLVMQCAKFTNLWRSLLAASVALSLFTPLFWYIDAGLSIVALLHPYTRYALVSKKYRRHWIIPSLIFLAITAPLAYLCWQNPGLIQALSGAPIMEGDLLFNLKAFAKTYFWPAPTIINGQVLPAIDISALVLIILGAMVTLRRWHTARAYVIGAWLVASMPLLMVIPRLQMIITVPMFILLATGVETLLHEWYKLFPKNPYARTTGLTFMVILIGLMTIGGANRYVHSYHDLPDAMHAHSIDLRIINSKLRQNPENTLYLVVSSEELPVFEALSRGKDQLTASSELPSESTQNLVISRTSKSQLQLPQRAQLTEILTNSRTLDADRFYVYKIQD